MYLSININRSEQWKNLGWFGATLYLYIILMLPLTITCHDRNEEEGQVFNEDINQTKLGGPLLFWNEQL